MFLEYATINKILYRKDTPEEIYSRFSDVEHMTFNANAFEKNISGIEKEIKNVDDSMRAEYSDKIYSASTHEKKSEFTRRHFHMSKSHNPNVKIALNSNFNPDKVFDLDAFKKTRRYMQIMAEIESVKKAKKLDHEAFHKLYFNI